ncbi:3-dehydroquinate synthase [Spirochaeta isovalerica]|uniref:3-dehydroquinate synthase n=1 Tax=Spirochaeta isovalerica TaxID=150 RepID=A0A841R8B5_9SPIO|nr:3-dehydroquinate synthase [Spirochaeta isovalerica]MBB6480135.1 3-dehydroquinate synthase [Spirochaeta isovalerica]
MNDIRTFHFGPYTTRTFFCSPEEVLEDALLVFDDNTAHLFPNRSQRQSVILPPGEKAKNWASVEQILEKAVEAEYGRDGCFAGIGGGVICDMTAFAASVYMRGCSVILVPTTLLAMVDASLGGKTGIDFAGYKNMVGSFYPASEVRYCPELLKTLPEREYLSGLGEVIKTAMLGDRELFDILKENRESVLARDPQILTDIIKRCIMVKGRVVEEDLRETGVRATLNLGHTFAHALESVSGFSSWSHGEAVAWGLLMAMETGVELGITDNYYAIEVRKMLEEYNFRLYAEFNPDELITAMSQDKKKKGGIVNFILQERIEKTLIRAVDRNIILKVLNRNLESAGDK